MEKETPSLQTKEAAMDTKGIFFALARYDARALIEMIIFTTLAIVLPALLAHTPNNQWITGTIVNAILFAAALRIGIVNAAAIGILPSVIALVRGLLPAPMAVMIPYIMLGNMAMITTFGLLRIRSLVTRVIAASLFKFVVIFAASSLAVIIPANIIRMMQWPQLITALAGGMAVIAILKTSKWLTQK